MNNICYSFAIDVFLPVAKTLTLSVFGAVILACILLLILDKVSGVKKAKTVFLIFAVYCLCVGVCCLVLDIIKHYSTEYTTENWLDKDYLLKYVLYPLCVFAVGLLFSIVALSILSKKQYKNIKRVKTTVLLFNIFLAVFTVVMLAKYYDAKISADGYYNSDSASVNQLVLYSGSALLIIGIIALAFTVDKDKTPFSTRCLAYAGVCLATTFCLSYIKIFRMPQGGSITLASLLPLCIFSFKFGIKKGVLVGFAYGVLSALQDPFIIHPAQFLLDYPIAFTCIGIAGIFKNTERLKNLPQVKFLLGGLLSGVLRFVCHTLSGVFAFSAYAEGANPLTYSLIYNAYVLIDIAIVVLLGALLFSSKALYRELILK